MSDESIKPLDTSNYSLAYSLDCAGVWTRVKFAGQWLKQDKITLLKKRSGTFILLMKQICGLLDEMMISLQEMLYLALP